MCDPHGKPNLLTGAATDTWKAVRRAVAVSFSTNNIRKKYPLVLSRINELVARVAAQGPGAPIDVDQAALRVTLDVIGLAGFGHDYQSVKLDHPPRDHLLRVLPRCFTEVMLRVANPLRPAFPHWFKSGDKGARAACVLLCAGLVLRFCWTRRPHLHALPVCNTQPPLLCSTSQPYFPPPSNPPTIKHTTHTGLASFASFQAEMRVLLDEMKARGPPAADDHDIASQLYRVMQEHPEVDEARVLSEIGILFVEGFETTGHTTAWTLLMAATHAGVQERIAEELDAAGLLAKPGCPPPREMEFEDLKKLPYLTAVAKEAMRMLPVVSLMGRVTARPVKVGKYRVPAGVVVGTPLYAIHVSTQSAALFCVDEGGG